MGIKYNREYQDIIAELTKAMMEIHDLYEFFQMDHEDWKLSSDEERMEYTKTLADDVFYGLGTEGTMEVASSTIKYDKGDYSIKVIYSDDRVKIVNLT